MRTFIEVDNDQQHCIRRNQNCGGKFPKMKQPIPTPVYHLTHIDNLSGIIKESGLSSHNRKIEKGIIHKDIAYHSLQDRRAETTVDCSPFGTLHDYVPFFLGPRPSDCLSDG